MVSQKIYITSNKCFSSTVAEPGRGLTIKVRETLMRQDYDDGVTLATVSHSVAKETVSPDAQRVPVLHAGGWVDESQWESWLAAATQEGTAFFCSSPLKSWRLANITNFTVSNLVGFWSSSSHPWVTPQERTQPKLQRDFEPKGFNYVISDDPQSLFSFKLKLQQFNHRILLGASKRMRPSSPSVKCHDISATNTDTRPA